MDDRDQADRVAGLPAAGGERADDPVRFDALDGNALGDPPDHLAPGDRLGRYVIDAEIGSGSLGRVYRARDPLAGRMVAIKTLRFEYQSGPAAEAYRQRMKREAHAAGRLSHPAVVRIFDCGEACLVMELLNGALLSELLRVRGAIPVEEALAILGPVAEALDHAHARKVIHRGVRPSNVMVLRDGSPRLLDFGFALFAGETAAPGDKFLGAPHYMAPEQIADGLAGPLTDQFALAVVAYQMLTGRRPFDGDSLGTVTYRVVFGDLLPPTEANLRLPEEFDEVFARALNKSPGRRFATVSSFIQALSANAALSVRMAAPLSPPTARRRRYAVEETMDLARAEAPAPAGEPSGLSLPGPPAAPGLAAAPPVERCALQVESDPVGATVWLDGALAGATPVHLLDLAAGTHTVRVHEDGFAPAQMLIDLWPAAVAPRIRLVLHPVARAALAAALERPLVPGGPPEPIAMPARRAKPS